MLSLEAVAMLPVLALLMLALFETAGVMRDVLLVHEAARAGARTAATTTGTPPVADAARRAAEELDLRVSVDPVARGDGDLVTVVVTTQRRVGPVTHTVSARAVARVEPAVGTTVRGSVPP